MKAQSYYRIRQEECNICDEKIDFLVNCAGFTKKTVNTQRMRHDYYLMYVTDGEMTFEINDEKSSIGKGQFIIISPETKYFFKTNSNDIVSYFWMHFTGSEIKNFLSKSQIDLCRVYEIGEHRSLYELWQKVFNELILYDNLSDEATSSLFKTIIVYLSRYIYTKSTRKFFFKSIIYIHENFSKEIDISELAEMEKLHITSYRKKFHELFGCSPKEYIIDIRLNQACQLINESEMKIKEIASLVGYDDAYYFSRIFKNKIGVSPSDFKKR